MLLAIDRESGTQSIRARVLALAGGYLFSTHGEGSFVFYNLPLRPPTRVGQVANKSILFSVLVCSYVVASFLHLGRSTNREDILC